ncbi:cytochrome P450 [Phascolomyces articulosus]|uniref:Cytochrome P450 n=1 Tax=Phascolomyces articulosus TaxID=60185 RepID=A0AAD5K620_9FUNG|nr:cytochrome P450 [Phascolomyces articulosus]
MNVLLDKLGSLNVDKILLQDREAVTKISVASAVTIYCLYCITHSLSKKLKRKIPEGLQEIPSPPGALPYFGHYFKMNRRIPSLHMDEWHKKYGPILRVTMGSHDWIIIGNQYVATDILKGKNGAATSGRPYHFFMNQFFSLNSRGTTFTNPDKRWKKNRAILHMLLGPKAVKNKVDVIEKEATHLADLLTCNTAKNGYVNIIKYMQFAPLNVIMHSCFGITGKSLDDPVFKAMIDNVDRTIWWAAPRENVHSFLPGLSSFMEIFTGTKKKMRDFTYKERNPLFRRLIQEAREHNGPCFVKELYKIKEEENTLDDDDILVFMANMVNAGTDMTALTLSWAFVILSHRKDLQKIIQEEIDSFVATHGRLPTYDERENLPHMISIQKECMRYRSTNHFTLAHESTADIEYNGYFIPKGTTILANTYQINRNTKFYKNPEEFDPDRYMNDLTPFSVSVNAGIEKRDQFVFGWGRRSCPGVHLADVEMFYAWTRIFAISTIEPPLNEAPSYPDVGAYRDLGLVVGPRDEKLRFVERSNSLI